MTRLPHRRLFRSIPAWLAVFAVCMWPAFAAANCCCSKESTVVSDAEHEAASSESCPHCQENGESTTDRICESDSNAVLDKQCGCELRCCDFEAVVSHQVMVSGERDADPLLDDPGTPIAHVMQPPADDNLSPPLGTPVLEEDGSSNCRCALLCRWLK